MTRPYNLSPEGRERLAANGRRALAIMRADPEKLARQKEAARAALVAGRKNPVYEIRRAHLSRLATSLGLTDEQRKVYDKLRRHGVAKPEALAAARRGP